MAENLHDTASTFDQNESYLKDPTSSESRPYSTKQKAANQAHKGKTWLYHKIEGSRVFSGLEVDQALDEGWVDTPYVHPNNPDHIPVKATPEREILLAEAKNLGIKVDKRWGDAKLKEELLKASDG